LPAPSSPSSPPLGEAVRVDVPASPSFSLGGASGIGSDTSDLTSLPTYEEEWSTKASIDQDAALGELMFNYENIKWERCQASIDRTQLIGKLSSGMWKLGVPTEHTATHHGGCAPPAIAPTQSNLLNTIIASIKAAQVYQDICAMSMVKVGMRRDKSYHVVEKVRRYQPALTQTSLANRSC
jgi:hypothetical protein